MLRARLAGGFTRSRAPGRRRCDATLDHLAQGDPVVHRTIDDTAMHWKDISVTLPGEEIRWGGN